MSKSKLVKCRVRKDRKFHGIKPRAKDTDEVVRYTAVEGDEVLVSATAAERFSSALQPLEDFKREVAMHEQIAAEAKEAAKQDSSKADESEEDEDSKESKTEEADADKEKKPAKAADSKKSG